MSIKSRIIQSLPPTLFLLLKGHGWYGNFSSWEEASKHSEGYDQNNILDKVKQALLMVKEGKACYERDSVLFNHIEYAWELLAGIMWIAAQNGGRLNLIDFGGSLGSTYYQNRSFLASLQSVVWSVVEQPHFVEVGRADFQDSQLKFYLSITDSLRTEGAANCILFSSVLQYLPNPYPILEEAFASGSPYIIVDRTGFTLSDSERVTIQQVPSTIYKASYPCRFFSESSFVELFRENGYTVMTDFLSDDNANIPSKYKGFIFQKENKC